MWLASRQIPAHDEDSFLDRLLELAPDVYRGPRGSALVSLVGTAHYWLLTDLLAQDAPASHPFKERIKSLARDYGSRFTLAPTPAFAFWAAHTLPTEAALHAWDKDSIRRDFARAPIASFRELVADLEDESTRHRQDADAVAERMDDLGLRRLSDLEELRSKPDTAREVHARFGSLGKTLLERLKGSERFHMKRHEPSPVFFREFHPEIEKSMGVEGADDLFGRLREILESWQLRLEARKSSIKGLEVAFQLGTSLRSEKTPDTRIERLEFPSPLKEAAHIHKLIQEKCLKSEGARFFEMPIERVFLRSLGIEGARERQLNLFDTRIEDSDESWSLLVGRLLARSTERSPVTVGRFEAGASYTPEASVIWKPWKPGETLIKVEKHPPRPQTLLPVPKKLDLPARSEGTFCAWVADKRALGSLERIGEDRLYARVDEQWIFWCARRKRVFLHGLFEGYGLP
jgi:hypothetical protein